MLICLEMCLIGVILILHIFFLKKKKIIIEFVKLTYSTMIDLIMNLNISYKKNEKNKIKPNMERFPVWNIINRCSNVSGHHLGVVSIVNIFGCWLRFPSI